MFLGFQRKKKINLFHQVVAQRNIVSLSAMVKKDKWLLDVSDENGWAPIHSAASNGDIDTAEALIDFGADLKKLTNKGRGTIHLAVLHGHIDMVELLISNGCPVDLRTYEGDTALLFAAQSGQLHMVKLLLTCGADPAAKTGDGRRVIDHAADEELKLLMKNHQSRGNKPSASLT